MSWIEKVKEQLVIITGDSKQHSPLYINANKLREYNTSEFDFINTSGTYINRKLPRGRKYGLDIVFQGVNHLDLAAALEASTDASSEPWQIRHPYYGNLLVQPTSLSFENSELNITRIAAVVLETISFDKVNDVSINSSKTIASESLQILAQLVADLGNDIASIAAVDKANLRSHLQNQLNSVSNTISNIADANNYINEFNKSTSLLNTIGSTTVSIGTSIQHFTAMPYAFLDAVGNRLRIFVTQFELLKGNANNLFKRNSKKLLEFQMSSVMASALHASVYNANYNTVDEIEEVLDILADLEDEYVNILDGLSSGVMVDEDSYLANYETVRRILYLCAYVHDNLVRIAKYAKVKYELVLLQESTIFELTAMLYGFDDQDENLNRLIADNNITVNEYLKVKSGRKLVYFK